MRTMVLCSILLVLIAESSEGPPHVTASNRRDATWNRRSIGKDRFISRLVHALLGLEWEVAGLLFIGLRYSLRSIKTTRPRADELRSLIATDDLHSYFRGQRAMPTFAHLRRSFRSGGLLFQLVRCHGSRASAGLESLVSLAPKITNGILSRSGVVFLS
jgi:hypothetical protein